MVDKYKLNLAVGFTILLVTIWLIWTKRVWDFVGHTLLARSIVLIILTLLKKERKPAKLLKLFVESLVVFYVAINVTWFIWLGITAPQYYAYLDLERLVDTLVPICLSLSLFPVAISIIIYGIFRIKLRTREIFLSSCMHQCL
jgi:hypothetical protein